MEKNCTFEQIEKALFIKTGSKNLYSTFQKIKMFKKITILGLLFSLFFISNIAFAAEKSVEKSEGFTIAPANPNTISPRKFLFELKPGESAAEYAIIQNLSDQEADYFLYGSDSTLSNKGNLAYKTRQDNGPGQGKWISFEQNKITLKAQEAKLVKFTVSVPDKTEFGDYKVGITMEKTKNDAKNPNITIATRVIIHSEIKVTANPRLINKEKDPAVFNQNKIPNWQSYYFWISLCLFIISLSLLIWTTINERKKSRSRRKNKS